MTGLDFRQSTIHERIFRIALPACLANLTSVLPALADSAFIGRTGSALDLGGMAIATTYCCFVLWAFGFLRMATAGFTAQAFGADDPRELKAVFWRATALAIAFGLLLVIFSISIGVHGLALFGAQYEIRTIAEGYWYVRMVAAPGDLVVYVVLGWLIGLQRPRTFLMLQIFLNVLNILLCAVFVVALGWGVPGAAFATDLAFVATAVLGVTIIVRAQRKIAGDIDRSLIFDRARIMRLMSVNRDLFLRTILLMAFLGYLVRLGAGLGGPILAGNHILLGFIAVIAQMLDGVTQATESLTGAAVGANDGRELGRITRATTIWCAALAVAIGICLSLFGPFLLPLFTTDQAVLSAANEALIWLSFSPLVSVWCFQLDGIYFGATRSTEMRNGMILAAAGALITSWLAIPAFGNDGLWLSLYVFYLLRALPLALWYPRIARSLPRVA